MNAPRNLRHELHSYPELSGRESATAQRLCDFFAPHAPDDILTGLGGHGVAVVFGTATGGPTILLRAELDALPIQESNAFPYRSRHDGVSHKCGHDGHMAILSAVGLALAAQRPPRGRVVLLFQPAEETGCGAAAIVSDPAFRPLWPDRVYGLHNLPGVPLGQVVVRDGTFCCASRGISIGLEGRTAHAAQPETGTSPALAMSRIVAALADTGSFRDHDGKLAFATVVGATLGERAFGVAPGSAEIWATLRSDTDDGMSALVAACESRVREIAAAEHVAVTIGYDDVFAATVNSARAVATIRAACTGEPPVDAAEPFRWSEDFGCFTRIADGAFFGLGAGLDVPELHNDDYDFPDALIEAGAAVFLKIVAATQREFAP